jgi:microcystin-dependent protein
MADPFVGQIITVGFNFAPLGWLVCDGSRYPISEYSVLYTLLGTTYGGDGVTTFAVPDLRGRVAVCQGQGPGQSDYVLGQTGGAENVTLGPDQIGAHGHGLLASAETGTFNTPGATMALAVNGQTAVNMYGKGEPDVTLAPGSIEATDVAALPHENRQPLQVINHIICWAGVFPQQT